MWNRKNSFVMLGLMSIIGFMVSVDACAQLISPKIFLNYNYIPPADLTDTTGQYAAAAASIGFSVPVYGKIMQKEPNSGSFLLVHLNGEFELESKELGALDDDRLFFKPWIGTSMFYHTGTRSTFMGNLSFRWMEDEITGADPKVFPTALFLWRIKQNERLSYVFGTTFTYTFGAGLPIPILGLNMDLGNNSKLNLILPLSIEFQKSLPKGQIFRLFLSPDGDVTRMGNNQVFPKVQAEDLVLGKRYLKFGLSYSLARNGLRIMPEIGVLGRRSLTFSDSETSIFKPIEFYSTGIDPTPFFKLRLTINLNGKSFGPVDALNTEWMGF
jgi:hypothetical protein